MFLFVNSGFIVKFYDNNFARSGRAGSAVFNRFDSWSPDSPDSYFLKSK